MEQADIAIVGAGIAGASLAAELAGHGTVVLIEAEAQPGYHSTGRSAAFWSETYGGPHITPLTQASGHFLREPPPAFHEGSLLHPRGRLTLAREEDRHLLEATDRAFAERGVSLELIDRSELERRVGGLRDSWYAGLVEPNCCDIDVAALHGGYLKAARRQGVKLLTDARVTAVERLGASWRIDTSAGVVRSGVLVDAAGAWADAIAVLAGVAPVGIQPHRRTIVQLRTDPSVPASLPLVMDVRQSFYFKPEAGGRLWLSPQDETPIEACDVRPEELDIAIAIDRFESAVDWRVERVENSWAGLRSFAPDRLPVYGFDARARGFFWFAGQGGFGIQTSPAAAKLAAALLLGTAPQAMVADIDPTPYSASRFAD